MQERRAALRGAIGTGYTGESVHRRIAQPIPGEYDQRHGKADEIHVKPRFVQQDLGHRPALLDAANAIGVIGDYSPVPFPVGRAAASASGMKSTRLVSPGMTVMMRSSVRSRPLPSQRAVI
jgi:hypothetical protein